MQRRKGDCAVDQQKENEMKKDKKLCRGGEKE